MGSACFDLFAGVFIEPVEVVFEHVGYFHQVLVVFMFVSPHVLGVQHFRINASDTRGVLELQNGELLEGGFFESTVVNGVDDLSSHFD